MFYTNIFFFNVKIILQTLWERYLLMFSETSSNIKINSKMNV